MEVKICNTWLINDIVCITKPNECSNKCDSLTEIKIVDYNEIIDFLKLSHKEQVEYILKKE